ncbi:type IVB secretion system protein IcmH/DotU [Sphingomonas sp. Leaf242]|uniref:type IVB secretion system protein IcmH/DotU n=1 Tax=Sphingomonas sp. Leaf242 TaxID=1736304 RepID=UPI000712FE03|nr:type IVB secretion system protein IcmH/DotU [Sphingomonas sp. Leaf242]KQO09536.1 type IV secretion protein DotU [Sphingomonas sp. Leaf242]
MREASRTVSVEDGNGGKTVFRPSPLQGLKQGASPPPPPPPSFPPPFSPAGGGGSAGFQPADPGYGTPPPLSRTGMPSAGGGLAPSRLAEDDVPLPATPRVVRNIMLAVAEPVLALVASVRSGRVRLAMPEFHRQASQAIARFDQAIAPHYSEEMRQRAKYAVCATTDDVAQNLPAIGTDGAEWARRSMVVQFFQENIGGDRFWQLVDDMLRVPNDNYALIELYHACLAAGFEGRFRVMPDGRRRLHEIMARLQGALPHVRSQSATELSPRWRGETAPVGKLGFWSLIALASAIAAGLLLLVFIVLRLMLMSSGDTPGQRLGALRPEARLTLSRPGGAIATADSAQASKLKRFLEPEIREGLVVVEEDAQTVRVRTTVGQLFRSGSDVLEPGREPLFHRIGRAIEDEKGDVLVEGHADSDRVASLAFPDNMALSQARAETVGDIVRTELSETGRVTTKGLGDTVPIASNDDAAGKSQNRRVEIVVPRRY